MIRDIKAGVPKLFAGRATCGEMNICGGRGVSKKCTHSYTRKKSKSEYNNIYV